MSKILRIFQPKEIQIFLSLLDELSIEYNSVSFELVRKVVEEHVLERSGEFIEMIRDGVEMRQWLVGFCSNIAGDMAESGKYHLYRGMLNPLGEGKDLLKIYNKLIDELLRMGEIESEFAKTQKEVIRENIRDVG